MDRSTSTATIYITAGQYSSTGPFGWVARTVTPDGFSELCGHDRGPFARLYIVGTIEALNALPEGSTVTVISSDQYLVKYVIDRIDALIAGKVKGKKPLANKDLFPEVLRARNKHAKVTTSIVPAANRNAEHDEAMASLGTFLDAIKLAADEGEPMPIHKARKAVSLYDPDGEDSGDDGASLTQAEADKVILLANSRGAAVDVPW